MPSVNSDHFIQHSGTQPIETHLTSCEPIETPLTSDEAIKHSGTQPIETQLTSDEPIRGQETNVTIESDILQVCLTWYYHTY